jgi:hypothetical protein
MSERFERWKELAAQCLREQDPAKLAALAHEMNLALNDKGGYLNPPRQERASAPPCSAAHTAALVPER